MDEYIEKWSVVNRLIDLENEFQQYKPFRGFEHAMYRKICEAEIAIGKTQAADVAPVRHGRWVTLTECANEGVYCSVCHKKVYRADYAWCAKRNKVRSNYCPNCGAIMDGGDGAKIVTDQDELDSVENLLKELAEWRKLGPLGAVQELVRAEAEGRVTILPEDWVQP